MRLQDVESVIKEARCTVFEYASAYVVLLDNDFGKLKNTFIN